MITSFRKQWKKALKENNILQKEFASALNMDEHEFSRRIADPIRQFKHRELLTISYIFYKRTGTSLTEYLDDPLAVAQFDTGLYIALYDREYYGKRLDELSDKLDKLITKVENL